MKKGLMIPLPLTALIFYLAVSPGGGAVADGGHEANNVVGVWEVDADAPYRPHLFTFHADGTMSTTNPTNVEESADRSHGGTNDSIGMGVWRTRDKDGMRFIVGTFEQLNAYVDNHQPTNKLKVSFRITVTGDTFDGPAVVHLGADVAPSRLRGTRLLLDQDAIDGL